MTFIEEFLQVGFKASHFRLKLFGRKFDVFNLDLEILPRAEGKIFLSNLIETNEDAKIFDFLPPIERVDNVIDFVVRKMGALILRPFDFLLCAEIGSVDEQNFIVRRPVIVEEDDRNICSSVSENIRGHGDNTAQNFLIDDVLTNL